MVKCMHAHDLYVPSQVHLGAIKEELSKHNIHLAHEASVGSQ